jgi:hypothetical protein
MSALREILAKFSIDVDDKALAGANEKLEHGVNMLGNFAGALGIGMAVHAIKEFVVGLTEEAIAVSRQATAIGMSAAEMQSWQYAAKLSGVSSEALTAAMGRLQRAAAAAGTGGGAQAAVFKKLGVSVKDTDGHLRTGGEVFGDVAEKLGEMHNATERNAMAAKLFGRGFLPLIPLFDKGKEGIAELRKQFAELGGGFSDDFIDKAKVVEEQERATDEAVKQLKIGVASELLPVLIKFLKWLSNASTALVKIAKHTKIFQVIAVAMGTKGLMMLITRFGGLRKILELVGKQFLTTILPLLLVEDLIVFLMGGHSAIGDLIDAAFGEGSAKKVQAFFQNAGEDVRDFIDDTMGHGLQHFKEIFAAMGDWVAQAASIVVGGIVFVFTDGFAALSDLWTNWQNFVLDGCLMIARGISKVLSFVPGFDTSGLDEAIKFLDEGHGVANARDINSRQAAATLAVTRRKMDKDEGTMTGGPAHFEREYQRQNQQVEAAYRAANPGVSGPPPPLTLTTNITINVPPGTPATLAPRVGEAAAKGAAKGHTKAATVQGAG